MIGIDSHNEIMSKRLLEDNIELGNALVDMYATCGKLEKAQKTVNDIFNSRCGLLECFDIGIC